MVNNIVKEDRGLQSSTKSIADVVAIISADIQDIVSQIITSSVKEAPPPEPELDEFYSAILCITCLCIYPYRHFLKGPIARSDRHHIAHNFDFTSLVMNLRIYSGVINNDTAIFNDAADSPFKKICKAVYTKHEFKVLKMLIYPQARNEFDKVSIECGSVDIFTSIYSVVEKLIQSCMFLRVVVDCDTNFRTRLNEVYKEFVDTLEEQLAYYTGTTYIHSNTINQLINCFSMLYPQMSRNNTSTVINSSLLTRIMTTVNSNTVVYDMAPKGSAATIIPAISDFNASGPLKHVESLKRML